MADRNVIREDVVQVDFEVENLEDITAGTEEMERLRDAVRDYNEELENTHSIEPPVEPGTPNSQESPRHQNQNITEEFLKIELFGKLTNAGKQVINTFMDCVDASAEFEVSLAKLSTIADTSTASMGTLSEDLLALSNDTGVAVTSLTESAYQAISASVDTANAVDFVAEANALAVGGFTSTETAVDVLSTAINAYGLEVEQAGQLSDYLITTQNLGKTSVDQLAQSVGTVIPLASAYSVEMDNLSTAYAVLTANGIATAEAGTYLRGMLSELADSGSMVAGILEEETGLSFTQLSESGMSLGDVLGIIGDSVNNDTTAFSNLWGNVRAGVGALSLLNSGTERYNNVLGEMRNSTGAAQEAYAKMIDTATSAHKSFINSANNLKIAIGNSLLSTFEGLNKKGSEMLNWITDFVKEHESLVAGLTAGVAVAALLTIGLSGLAIAITTVKSAISALNITIKGFKLTAGGLISIISLVATGIGVLVGCFASGKEEVEDYDGTLEECRTELEQTELALRKAKERYGENSAVVKELKSDVETLTAQYEKGGGAIGEFQEKISATNETLKKYKEENEKANEEIDKTTTSGLQAVSMFEGLMSKTELTNEDLETLSQYADYLNDTFNCNIAVDIEANKITGFDPEKIVDNILATAQNNKKQLSIDKLVDTNFTGDFTEAVENVEDINRRLFNAQKEYDEITKGWSEDINNTNMSFEQWKNATDRIGELEDEIPKLRKESEEATKELDDFEEELRKHAKIAGLDEKAIDKLVDSYKDAGKNGGEFVSSLEKQNEAMDENSRKLAEVETACSSAIQQIEELAKSYDDAQKSALESIQSQYNLWDKVDKIATMSVNDFRNSIQSQTEYWLQYNDNLSLLQEKSANIPGLADMLKELDDGSEESAKALAGLAQASDEELSATVSDFEKLQQQEKDTSHTMADVETQFGISCKNITSDMESMVDSLDMSSETAAKANATMNAFFDSAMDVILARSPEIQNAINNAVSSVTDGALSVVGHANGTTNAENVFMAGEEGAELIVGMGGSTVFPASETQKIINAVADYADFSGDYTPESNMPHSYNTVTTFAPEFYLTLAGGMNNFNQMQAKQWMKQVIDDSFASISRVNPSVYVI
ncbi:MAG: phage tail tape measure protein [Ruminococcus sp.]|nr:phage tail tape measure protein [Ruminococcus sp.]